MTHQEKKVFKNSQNKKNYSNFVTDKQIWFQWDIILETSRPNAVNRLSVVIICTKQCVYICIREINFNI